MEPQALRYVLITDWARIENTPVAERRPMAVQRWHRRANHLASLLGAPAAQVQADLKTEAAKVAARQRQEILSQLAHDLAVSQALGEPIPPPWQRRLQKLVAVMDLPVQSVRDRVDALAANVSVVVMP